MTDHGHGCLVCGAPLAYRTEVARVSCALCGVEGASEVTCEAGHFACDACHAAPALDVIERTCLASDATDPVALATRLMRHPSVKLHGPEHHFLVPAVLLTARANAGGRTGQEARLLAEARRRAGKVPGGSCGFSGACGAGVGVGIFAAVASGATPLAGESWGAANRATGRALTVIGGLGGPRCCKRSTWLAILTGMKVAREAFGARLDGHGAACEWSDRNAECLGEACPFHPAVALSSSPGGPARRGAPPPA